MTTRRGDAHQREWQSRCRGAYPRGGHGKVDAVCTERNGMGEASFGDRRQGKINGRNGVDRNDGRKIHGNEMQEKTQSTDGRTNVRTGATRVDASMGTVDMESLRIDLQHIHGMGANNRNTRRSDIVDYGVPRGGNCRRKGSFVSANRVDVFQSTGINISSPGTRSESRYEDIQTRSEETRSVSARNTSSTCDRNSNKGERHRCNDMGKARTGHGNLDSMAHIQSSRRDSYQETGGRGVPRSRRERKSRFFPHIRDQLCRTQGRPLPVVGCTYRVSERTAPQGASSNQGEEAPLRPTFSDHVRGDDRATQASTPRANRPQM